MFKLVFVIKQEMKVFINAITIGILHVHHGWFQIFATQWVIKVVLPGIIIIWPGGNQV